MRTLLIIGFFTCIYLHFQQDEVESPQLDTLSTKLSSVKKAPATAPEIPVVTHIQEELPHIEITPEDVAQNRMIETYSEYEGDDLSQLPWDDIEEGWKLHLRDFLISVEAERAEEIFAAYMEEKKKYVDRVDFSESENGVSEEGLESDDIPLVEHDGREGELERIHRDNLKDIFGEHFSQVEALHRDYVESVQYLNRSSVKFSISL